MAKRKDNGLLPEERLQAALVQADEQPYEIPGNWVWARGSAFLLPMEAKRPTGDEFCYIDIDAIDNENFRVTEPKTIDTKNAPSRASRGLKSGDTLFSMVRPYLRNIAFIDDSLQNCIASTGFFICRPSPAINSRYLYWLMTSGYVVDGLNANMKGDNSPSIRQDNIVEFCYPLPPLPEQQRIVERIESLFAKLDATRDLAQSALESFATRKTAILHRAFTGELTRGWREERGVSEDSWEEQTSDSIFEYVTSGSRGWAQYYSDIGAVFIRMGNLDHGTIELDLSDIQYVSLPDRVEGQRSKVQVGDILISITADVGMVGLVRDVSLDAYINQHVALARPINSVCAEFIAWYLVSDLGLSQLQNKQRGATKIGLGLGDILSLNFRIPSLPEQREIVRILDTLFSQEQQARDLCDVLDKVDLLKKAILARAFRGELGTNVGNEEHATEFLKITLEVNT